MTGPLLELVDVRAFENHFSTRVMIMHHGEMIYEGPPAGLVRDRNVVDVYLGQGTSARLEKFLSGATVDDGSAA